jgi:hypothetical protein
VCLRNRMDGSGLICDAFQPANTQMPVSTRMSISQSYQGISSCGTGFQLLPSHPAQMVMSRIVPNLHVAAIANWSFTLWAFDSEIRHRRFHSFVGVCGLSDVTAHAFTLSGRNSTRQYALDQL